MKGLLSDSYYEDIIGGADPFDEPVWSGKWMLEFFERNKIAKEDLNADIVDKYGMYVPNHQDLTSKDIKRVCSIINEETQ